MVLIFIDLLRALEPVEFDTFHYLAPSSPIIPISQVALSQPLSLVFSSPQSLNVGVSQGPVPKSAPGPVLFLSFLTRLVSHPVSWHLNTVCTQTTSKLIFKAQRFPLRNIFRLVLNISFQTSITDISDSTCLTQNSWFLLKILPSTWVVRNSALSGLKPQTSGYHQSIRKSPWFHLEIIFGKDHFSPPPPLLPPSSLSSSSFLPAVYPCLFFSTQQPELSLTNLSQILPFLCLRFSKGSWFISEGKPKTLQWPITPYRVESPELFWPYPLLTLGHPRTPWSSHSDLLGVPQTARVLCYHRAIALSSSFCLEALSLHICKAEVLPSLRSLFKNHPLQVPTPTTLCSQFLLLSSTVPFP